MTTTPNWDSVNSKLDELGNLAQAINEQAMRLTRLRVTAEQYVRQVTSGDAVIHNFITELMNALRLSRQDLEQAAANVTDRLQAQQLAPLQEEQERLQRRINELQNQLIEAQQRLGGVEQERDGARSEVQTLQDQMNVNMRALEDRLQAIQAINTQTFDQQQAEIERLQAELQNAQGQYRDVNARIQVILNQVQTMHPQDLQRVFRQLLDVVETMINSYETLQAFAQTNADADLNGIALAELQSLCDRALIAFSQIHQTVQQAGFSEDFADFVHAQVLKLCDYMQNKDGLVPNADVCGAFFAGLSSLPQERLQRIMNDFPRVATYIQAPAPELPVPDQGVAPTPGAFPVPQQPEAPQAELPVPEPVVSQESPMDIDFVSVDPQAQQDLAAAAMAAMPMPERPVIQDEAMPDVSDALLNFDVESPLSDAPESPLPVPESPMESPLPVPEPPMESPLPVPEPPMESPLPVPEPPMESPLPVPEPPMESPLSDEESPVAEQQEAADIVRQFIGNQQRVTRAVRRQLKAALSDAGYNLTDEELDALIEQVTNNVQTGGYQYRPHCFFC